MVIFQFSGSLTVSSSKLMERLTLITTLFNSFKPIPLVATKLPGPLMMADFRASHDYYSLELNFNYLLNELPFSIFQDSGERKCRGKKKRKKPGNTSRIDTN